MNQMARPCRNVWNLPGGSTGGGVIVLSLPVTSTGGGVAVLSLPVGSTGGGVIVLSLTGRLTGGYFVSSIAVAAALVSGVMFLVSIYQNKIDNLSRKVRSSYPGSCYISLGISYMIHTLFI